MLVTVISPNWSLLQKVMIYPVFNQGGLVLNRLLTVPFGRLLISQHGWSLPNPVCFRAGDKESAFPKASRFLDTKQLFLKLTVSFKVHFIT